jgi:hypothetical protein
MSDQPTTPPASEETCCDHDHDEFCPLVEEYKLIVARREITKLKVIKMTEIMVDLLLSMKLGPLSFPPSFAENILKSVTSSINLEAETRKREDLESLFMQYAKHGPDCVPPGKDQAGMCKCGLASVLADLSVAESSEPDDPDPPPPTPPA